MNCYDANSLALAHFLLEGVSAKPCVVLVYVFCLCVYGWFLTIS